MDTIRTSGRDCARRRTITTEPAIAEQGSLWSEVAVVRWTLEIRVIDYVGRGESSCRPASCAPAEEAGIASTEFENLRLLLTRSEPSCRDAVVWQRASSPHLGNCTAARYERRYRLESKEDAGRAFARIRNRLLRYEIYPESVVKSAICPPSELVSNALIVQRTFFGPIALESAVRVISLLDRPNDPEPATAFTYVTLKGHPERGIATFSLQLRPGNEVVFSIETCSWPGTWLTSVLSPVTMLIQRLLALAALRAVTREVQQRSKS